jgi:hypothetical protein
MGAFNTLTFDWTDKQSNQKYKLVLQFKYAENWQYDYKLGDVLKWNDHLPYNDGDKAAKEVLVEAIVEDETLPKEIPEDFEIFIKDNVIVDAWPLEDKKKYFNLNNHYLIVKK